jgi:ubiquinone/menaquinone biosynthesis C-methylase UbiE
LKTFGFAGGWLFMMSLIMSDEMTRKEAIKANIYVHSFLVNAGEYQKSPHFFSENIEKVKGIVKRVTEKLPSSTTAKAIDFGCGTGFMINIMQDRFVEVHGVDITLDMMKHIDLSSGNIFLHESLAENTPFANDTFDFATSYSFMDHLFNYHDFLKEAHRVLKTGGVFYSDLNPNRDFIMAMNSIERIGVKIDSAIVEKEIKGALHNGTLYQESFGMNADFLEKAEPGKSKDKGFDVNEVLAAAKATGFNDCHVEFEWFLGQGKVMHEQSFEKARIVDEYLASVLPASSQLYKYLRFIFIK